MTRREELLQLVKDDITLIPLIDDIVFLESQLTELKKLPFIRINPNNPSQQKTTPAAKQYKEFLQQYTNCIKVIARATGADESDDESPLRKWVKAHVNNSR